GGADTLTLGGRTVPSRAYVASFNFKGSDQQKRVADLSGGERNRLHLATVLRSGANLLLLDEPTNDLDVDTLRALEEALLDFPEARAEHPSQAARAGAAVAVDHERPARRHEGREPERQPGGPLRRIPVRDVLHNEVEPPALAREPAYRHHRVGAEDLQRPRRVEAEPVARDARDHVVALDHRDQARPGEGMQQVDLGAPTEPDQQHRRAPWQRRHGEGAPPVFAAYPCPGAVQRVERQDP